MPKFRYTAYDIGNQEKRGVVEALNLELATAQIRNMGLQPFDVKADEGSAKRKPKSGSGPAVLGGSAGMKRPMTIGPIISQKGLTIFTRQLATLIQAGLPLLRAVEVLERQEKNLGFKYVLHSISETIKSGNSLSDGLQQHPRVFDRLFVNMVRAGEAGGVLDVVLSRLAKFMEKAMKIKSRVKSAMVYPTIIMIVAGLILAMLMIVVVPKFEEIFQDLLKGQPLPLLTQFVLGVANAFRDHFLVTAAGIGAVVALFYTAGRTKSGKRVIDFLAIRMPPVGDLFLKAGISRFARTLGTLLQSGVPILQSLVITRDTMGNLVIMEAIEKVHDRVKEGEGVAGPLEQARVFPSMVTSMIDVGEETGELPEMLNRIADNYDEEVDTAVAGLTSIIEPIMIVFMAVIVGTIVIALFLPIISIIQNMSSGG